MHQPKQLVFTLSALLLSSFSGANKISSCLDVDCPTEEGTTSANCQVANQTHVVVGISSYSVSIPGQDDDLELSWTVGARSYEDVEPDDGKDRYVERVYYLGTPTSVDLKDDDLGYDGCAIYLTGPENQSLFHMDPIGGGSYCREYLKSDCVSDLNYKLTSLAEKTKLDSSVSEICSKLASGLESSIPSKCSSLKKMKDLLVRGVPLTGPSAAEPFTEKQNSSSNCHPTLPQSNDLTRQFAYNISTTRKSGDTYPAIEGETPILSVFWTNEGDKGSEIKNATAELSCLRPIDKTTASNDSKESDGGDDDNGAIPMNGGANILGAAVTAGIVVFFSWLV